MVDPIDMRRRIESARIERPRIDRRRRRLRGAPEIIIGRRRRRRRDRSGLERRRVALHMHDDHIFADIEAVAVAQPIGRLDARFGMIDESPVHRDVGEIIAAVARGDLAMAPRDEMVFVRQAPVEMLIAADVDAAAALRDIGQRAAVRPPAEILDGQCQAHSPMAPPARDSPAPRGLTTGRDRRWRNAAPPRSIRPARRRGDRAKARRARSARRRAPPAPSPAAAAR